MRRSDRRVLKRAFALLNDPDVPDHAARDLAAFHIKLVLLGDRARTDLERHVRDWVRETERERAAKKIEKPPPRIPAEPANQRETAEFTIPLSGDTARC